jgi:hypothetical protein
VAGAPPRNRVLSGSSETELVGRAAKGDLAAFAALVRAHEATLRRFTRRLAGDDGDDIAQETLLAAWRALGQWRGEGSFAAGCGPSRLAASSIAAAPSAAGPSFPRSRY